ncbi:hypothetical protein B0H66DRAFT_486236 [Apodospora peruviana]|uniref:Rhodopsin domain-containing protein n=1 Tax=Apodospora peruviana TaxID=516989 RepID=A0AAE0HUA4_9PEZI|nr:hypothetical protein B0H66DRAFT_486236 [Apodospora peruviana]
MSGEQPAPHHSAEYLAEDRGPLASQVICSVGAVMTVFVLARLYVRGVIMRKLFADDWFIIAATVCSWIAIGMSVEGARWGNGRHFDALTLEEKSQSILLVSASFVPSLLSFGLPKFAIVALLCRLLNPARWHRIFLWCWTSFVLACVLVGPLLHFTTCSPSRALWDFSVKNPVCRAPDLIVKWSYFSATVSALTDLYLAVYPSVVLWNLQINARKKLALCVALGFGAVSTGIAIYKVTRLYSLASPDVTYDTADLVIWTITEGSSIIIASCIPLLQPLVDILSGKKIKYDQSQGYKRYGSSDGKNSNAKSAYQHELSNNSANHSSHGRSRLKRVDPDEELLHTVQDKLESQESIVSMSSPTSEKTMSHSHSVPAATYNTITRTQEVNVEYSNDTTGVPKKGQWGGFPGQTTGNRGSIV